MTMDNSGVWIGTRLVIVLAKVDHCEWGKDDDEEGFVVVDRRVAKGLAVYTDRDTATALYLDISNGDADAFLMALATYWETRT